jgi:hypothetical protein
MRAGLQAGFNGDPLGAELLARIKELGFEVLRVEAGPNPAAAAGEVIEAGLIPLVICTTLHQIQQLPPEAWLEVGNEPDLEHFLRRDFGGSVARWQAVSMAASEHHLDTGRPVFLGAVSNLNDRGFAFLQRLNWRTIPSTVGCSFHRYPESGSYHQGHDGRSRSQEYDTLLRIVGDRPLAMTETGYSKAEWRPRDRQAEALAFERAFWQARDDRVLCAVAYQINDGPSDEILDGYGFRDTVGRWKTELVEAWVTPALVEPVPAPVPVPVPPPAVRTYEVPIDFSAPGLTLKGTLLATVTEVPTEPPPVEPPPVEPPPVEPPAPELFDLHIWVKDYASRGIAGATVRRAGSDDARVTSGSGHTHFPVEGPAFFTVSADGYLETTVDLPPGEHNVHLARVAVPAREGVVSLERFTFRDDAGSFLSCDFTDMSALRLYEQDRGRYEENCRQMRNYGATSHRVLGMVGWQGREIDPRRRDIVDLTRATIVRGYELGVRARFTMFADCNVLQMGMPERRSHAEKIARGLVGLEHMIESIEVCNEPGNERYNGPWTPAQLVEIGTIIQGILPVPIGCGAPWGNPSSATLWTDENYRALMDRGMLLAYPHFDRDVWKHDGQWRPIRQPWEAYLMGYPFVNSEERSPGRLRAAATFTWMSKGASYCYHTRAGIGIDSDQLIASEPGAADVFDGARLLAPDTPAFSAHNWHWSSNPWETVDGSLSDQPSPETSRGSLRTISGTNGDDV